MKKSLRVKMTLILCALVFIIVTMSILISSAFLGDYYLIGKQRSLVETYNEINKVYSNAVTIISGMEKGNYPALSAAGETLPDITQDMFEQLAENRSLSILIFRDTQKIVYDFNNNTRYKQLQAIYSSIGPSDIENSNMHNDYVESQQTASVLKKTERYIIQKVYVSRLGSHYLYLSARLDNGDYLLLRSSYNSMEESVNISNRFILYVSLILLAGGIVVMMFVTRRFTDPIQQLSNIAAKMADLNFETKYDVQSDDEIGELGRSINHLSERLESTLGELKSANSELRKDLEKKTQIDEMRKEFLSNVSHELKTPIALIQGYAEGLSENISDDEESRDFYCEVIMDEANKMNELVKKLLNLNQLEFGNNKVNMEHFNLTEVIRNHLMNTDILFRQKGVRLELDAPEDIYAWADVYMVEEVFNNYLSNALNHVAGDKIIRVSIKKYGDTARASVYNTGDPIPEADIDQIWDKFYKVDKARTREYGGSGVGLSIVKASMELLGQSYGVENKAQGVEFFFELDAKNC